MAHFIMIDQSLPDINYTYFIQNSYNGSSITFNGVDIGTPRGDRYVIVAATYTVDPGASPFNETLLINGNAAARRIHSHDQLAFTIDCGAAIFIAQVPTGTTATMTFADGYTGNHRVGLGVWSVTGLLSSGTTDTGSANSSTTLNLGLNVSANGVAVAAAVFFRQASPGTTTWTGPFGVNYDVDPIFGTQISMTGGSYTRGSSGGAVGVTISDTNTQPQCGVSASFR